MSAMRFMGNLNMAVSEQQLGSFIRRMQLFSVQQWRSVILAMSVTHENSPSTIL
jgi:hypothetical protein